MGNELSDVMLDGTVSVVVDDRYMWAKVVVSKPVNGGRAITFDDVKQALTKNSVFRHIDEEKIKEYLANLPDENKSVMAAEGIPAVDGENGAVKYMFKPSNELKPAIDEKTGIVDFKELGRVHNVKKGTLIATIKINTMGTAGEDIRGSEIKPVPGTPAKYAVGTGTILSNDQTKIYAAEDGNLRWDKDRFVVDTVVNIGSDVDAAVGNINFVGDVVIKGGISEGYKVSGKNVTVKGIVSNAVVEASNSIDISSSGAVYSTLKCEGNIKLSFAENSTITCKGQLHSKSLVNCNVFSEGEVIVQGGKGIIVGGECTSYRNITAANVGSESYTKTVINLGDTAVLMKAHNELKEKYTELSENYKKLKNLYEKLNQLKELQDLTPEQESARRQAFLFIMNERNTLADMSDKIKENEAVINQSRQLQLNVKNRIYPGVAIKLYNAIYDVHAESGFCTFYLDSDNEIKMRAGR